MRVNNTQVDNTDRTLKSFIGMELLDLLLEQADGSCHLEGVGNGLANPVWPITDQSFMCDGEDAAVHFLDSLMCVSDCASDPGSPPWAPSPCDSGISEDPLSDQRDTPPPPSSPLFHSFFHSQHPLPQAQSQQQQLQQQARSTMSSAEPDVSIDVASWESSMFSYRPVVPECVPTAVQSPGAPTDYQLSVKDLLLSSVGEAYEEKMLKKIRRKIRNKQSAQESRKKKKEYVDGLEGRMAVCSAQNLELQKKVIQLEKTNTSLMEQLRKLQALVMNGSCKPAQTGTCILVLLMSFSLILFPSLQPVSLSRAGQPGDFTAARVQSRSLRSVLEVHSLQPVFSVDRGAETATPMITKMHIRPEYADMDSLLHNRSYGDEKHHHGDPITGHKATVGWLSRPDSGPYHQEDRK
ncbi:hypothetical protein AOLI_G00215880 [Acnodon oligacanthus]